MWRFDTRVSVTAVVNEGCRVVAEGVVDKAADLDVASVLAMGFPAPKVCVRVCACQCLCLARACGVCVAGWGEWTAGTARGPPRPAVSHNRPSTAIATTYLHPNQLQPPPTNHTPGRAHLLGGPGRRGAHRGAAGGVRGHGGRRGVCMCMAVCVCVCGDTGPVTRLRADAARPDPWRVWLWRGVACAQPVLSQPPAPTTRTNR
jgi:hypothetical protein